MTLRRIGGSSTLGRDVAYRFTGRQFLARKESRGLYSTPILNNLLLEGSTPPDMHQPTLLAEDSGALGQES